MSGIIQALLASLVAAEENYIIFGQGLNNYGQVGDGSNTTRVSPVQLGVDTDWYQVAGGGTHAVAVRTDGTIWAWGRNTQGECGQGSNSPSGFNTPQKVGVATNWAQCSAGQRHSLAVKTDGTLWGWGYSNSGQLPSGTTNVATQIGALTDWLQSAAGGQSSSCIKTDGTLWTWGLNNNGQLGDNSTTNSSSPVQVGALTDWAQVDMGNLHCAAVKTNGTLWAWGRNFFGQVGDGTTTNRSSPVQIGALTTWAAVACGSYHTMAVKTDGTLWSWGRNFRGQLGDGTTTDTSSPVQIGALTDWKKIGGGSAIANFYATSGGNLSGAVKTNGTLWTWGNNSSGQLGLGDATNRSSPVQVGSNTDWYQFAAGGFFAHEIAED